MSTERELTPGGPPQLHPLSYSDLATHIQLNGVNIMGKNFSGMFPDLESTSHLHYYTVESLSLLRFYPYICWFLYYRAGSN